MSAAFMRLSEIRKSYGATEVLKGVSLDVVAGSSIALLGENGAGKSTLAKIMAGAVQPSSGVITVSGRPVVLDTPRAAVGHQIAFIPQELFHVPRLTVAENICLGRLPAWAGLTARDKVIKRARQVLDDFELDLPLHSELAELPVAQQQLVEIAKALLSHPAMMILDEPTAALSSADSEHLLTTMARLCGEGLAAVYISHRLEEVFQSCDTVHVLRNGEIVSSTAASQAQPSAVIADMLGRPIENVTLQKRPSSTDRPGLTARGLNSSSTHGPLHDVDLTLTPGEVVVLYGLQGSGADTLATSLVGTAPRDLSGTLELAGTRRRLPRSPAQAKRLGIRFVPADRKSQGLSLQLPISTSLTLLDSKSVATAGVIRAKRRARLAKQLAAKTSLRYRAMNQAVADLSGGNQQKVLLASRLATPPPYLVLQEPTRGVDVGARLDIHRLLHETARSGTAILIVTSDIEEAVILADRLHILRHGRISLTVERPTLEDQHACLVAAGGIT